VVGGNRGFDLRKGILKDTKKKGNKRIVAFSRPAQFRLHLAKALGNSMEFEPKDIEEFKGFVEQVGKIDENSNT